MVGYDDYLDDDDLDLIEENLGVKVKRRVRILYHLTCLTVLPHIYHFWASKKVRTYSTPTVLDSLHRKRNMTVSKQLMMMKKTTMRRT